MIWLLACSAPWDCPPHLRRDPARADELGEMRICFGDVSPSVVTEDGVIWLDEALSPEAARARVDHLRHHRDFDPQGPDCLDQWMRREAEAYDLEVQARVRSGLPVRYGFPWSSETPAAERIDAIEAWLWAHPDGSAHIDALVESYRERCRRRR